MTGSQTEHEEPGDPDRDVRVGPLGIELAAEHAVGSIVRQRLGEWLDAHGWPPDERDDMVSAVYEAVSNVIEHAYGDGPHGAVVITGAVRTWAGGRRGQAVVTVRDRGRWKPVTDDPGYRGHGLKVMGALTARMTITNHPDGTEVILAGAPVPIRNRANPTPSPLHRSSAAVRVLVEPRPHWPQLTRAITRTMERSRHLCERAQAAHEATALLATRCGTSASGPHRRGLSSTRATTDQRRRHHDGR